MGIRARADEDQSVQELVRRTQAGDVIACNALLELLIPLVRRWCGPIALEEGADATQETLIVVFRTLRQLRDPSALFGWVRTIAVREAVRVATRRMTGGQLMDLPSAGDPQLLTDVRDVLGRLTPEHRAILMLRDMEGLDELRVAQILAIPVGTEKSRLSRARRNFRKEWQA